MQQVTGLNAEEWIEELSRIQIKRKTKDMGWDRMSEEGVRRE